jgi:hypothetical protein
MLSTLEIVFLIVVIIIILVLAYFLFRDEQAVGHPCPAAGCPDGLACDPSTKTCRVKPGGYCTADEQCTANATCQTGVCRIKVGVTAVGVGTLAPPPISTEITEKHREPNREPNQVVEVRAPTPIIYPFTSISIEEQIPMQRKLLDVGLYRNQKYELYDDGCILYNSQCVYSGKKYLLTTLLVVDDAMFGISGNRLIQLFDWEAVQTSIAATHLDKLNDQYLWVQTDTTGCFYNPRNLREATSPIRVSGTYHYGYTNTQYMIQSSDYLTLVDDGKRNVYDGYYAGMFFENRIVLCNDPTVRRLRMVHGKKYEL